MQDNDEPLIDLVRRSVSFRKPVSYLFTFQLFSEFKTTENLLYVVLEKGEADFAAYLRERRYSLHPVELRFFWMQMCKAVQAIHAAGKL